MDDWKNKLDELILKAQGNLTNLAEMLARFQVDTNGGSAGDYLVDCTNFLVACSLGLWAQENKDEDELDACVGLLNSMFLLENAPTTSKDELRYALGKIKEKQHSIIPPHSFFTALQIDMEKKVNLHIIFLQAIQSTLFMSAGFLDAELSEAEATYITACIDVLSSHAKVFFAAKDQKSLHRAHAKDTKKEPANTDSAADLASLLESLDSLVGLSSIKAEVKAMVSIIRVRKMREENGLPITPMSFHLVFTGNPGTGKTSVARLVAQIYQQLGVVSQGQLIETDRAGLVAGYMGQTALKTTEVVKMALGGVLFIDEAYTLYNQSAGDYGKEAIETLLKAMEDHRDNLVVIAAGYNAPMQAFVSSNPGLASRFTRFIEFPDYTGQELFAIFEGMLQKHGYSLDSAATPRMQKYLCTLYDTRTTEFGNARVVRNLFEKIISVQSTRLATILKPTKQQLSTLTLEDCTCTLDKMSAQ